MFLVLKQSWGFHANFDHAVDLHTDMLFWSELGTTEVEAAWKGTSSIIKITSAD